MSSMENHMKKKTEKYELEILQGLVENWLK